MLLTSTDEHEKLRSAAPAYWSIRSMRLKIVLLLCLAYISVTVARTSMSVAMVCMVNSTALAEMDVENSEWLYVNNRTNHSVEEQAVPPGCSLPDSVRSEYEGEFVWAPSDQSWIFAAVFWGSTLTTFATGFLADRYGPKNLYAISAVAVIIGTAFTPLAAHSNVWLVVLARLLIGLGSGMISPATSSMVSQWFPPNERSTTAAMYTSGNQLASVIGNPMAAYLCSAKGFLGGWPAIFYTNVLVLCVFFLLWMVFASSTPQENRFASQAEKNYISAANTTSGNRKDHSKIPWKAIFTSPVMYSLFANNSAAMMAQSFLQTYLPTYYKDVLLLDLKQNGFLSALPYICMIVMKMGTASIADYLKRRGKITPTAMCKIWNSVAGFGGAACMAGLAMMDCSTKTYALVLSCLGTGLLGGHATGFVTSMLMVAPRYAGLIGAISMTLGNISGALMPYIIGAVTPHGTADEWRIVFGIMVVVLVSSAVIFITWGSAEVQPWALNLNRPQSTIASNGVVNDAFESEKSEKSSSWEDHGVEKIRL
uniref:Major facilitator superfamily (MFS) profile domain-containing protein n=1 Tax=Plectus sambesii TaxID=2011161 RepID=A0A914WA44_9BILA